MKKIRKMREMNDKDLFAFFKMAKYKNYSIDKDFIYEILKKYDKLLNYADESTRPATYWMKYFEDNSPELADALRKEYLIPYDDREDEGFTQYTSNSLLSFDIKMLVYEALKQNEDEYCYKVFSLRPEIVMTMVDLNFDFHKSKKLLEKIANYYGENVPHLFFSSNNSSYYMKKTLNLLPIDYVVSCARKLEKTSTVFLCLAVIEKLPVDFIEKYFFDDDKWVMDIYREVLCACHEITPEFVELFKDNEKALHYFSCVGNGSCANEGTLFAAFTESRVKNRNEGVEKKDAFLSIMTDKKSENENNGEYRKRIPDWFFDKFVLNPSEEIRKLIKKENSSYGDWYFILRRMFVENLLREVYDKTEEKGYFEKFCEKHFDLFMSMCKNGDRHIEDMVIFYDFSEKFIEKHKKEFDSVGFYCCN